MTDVNEVEDIEAADGEQTRRSSHCYADCFDFTLKQFHYIDNMSRRHGECDAAIALAVGMQHVDLRYYTGRGETTRRAFAYVQGRPNGYEVLIPNASHSRDELHHFMRLIDDQRFGDGLIYDYWLASLQRYAELSGAKSVVFFVPSIQAAALYFAATALQSKPAEKPVTV